MKNLSVAKYKLQYQEMPDFYIEHYKAYHEKTFSIDPTSFLEPLARRLPPEAFILDVGSGSGRDLLWMKKSGNCLTPWILKCVIF